MNSSGVLNKYIFSILSLGYISCISFGQDAPVLPDTLTIEAPVDTTLAVSVEEGSTKLLSEELPIKIHSPSGAMWRSMFLPGGGQLYNRKYIKAALYGGGEIGFLYASLVQHRRYKQARRDHLWQAADFYENDRNRLRWWLAGLILFSMADAYVDGQLWDFELEKDLAWGLDEWRLVLGVKW